MGTNKVVTAVLLDVNRTMKDPTDNGSSYFQRSLSCLQRMVLRKMFSQNNDEMGIILFGSDETNNELAETSSRYRNISKFTPVCLPSWKLYRKIEGIDLSSQRTSDWLEAVVVAANYLKVETEGRRFRTKQLIIFSNCAGDIGATEETVAPVIDVLNGEGIQFVVVGNDMEEECTQGSEIPDSMKLLFSTVTKVDSGVHFSFSEIEKDLEYFEKKRKMGRLMKVNLIIGSNIHLPIRWMKVTNEETRFHWGYNPEKIRESLERRSEIPPKAEAASLNPLNAPSEMPRSSEPESLTSAQKVKDDSNLTTVEYVTDVVKRTNFGASIVELNHADLEAMKRQSGPASFYYLGSIKSSKISRSMFVANDVYVVVADKDARSVSMFSALVDALIKAKKYGLARRIPIKNGKISVGALLPVSDELGKAMYFIKLPYAEWVRKVPEKHKNEKTEELDEEVMKVMSDLIDSSMLPEDLAEEGKGLLVKDPTFQTRCHVLTQRALGRLPEHSLVTLPDYIERIVRPVKQSKIAKDALERLHEMLPYVPKEKKEISPRKGAPPDNPVAEPQPSVSVKKEEDAAPVVSATPKELTPQNNKELEDIMEIAQTVFSEEMFSSADMPK